MNYTSDNLYLVSFKDDTANFYVEQNFSLIPLFETKRIQDTNKIINCVGFQNNQIDCETFVKIENNPIPEKIKIKKLFPSNIDGRSRFFSLLEEHKELSGGKKRRSNKRIRRSNKRIRRSNKRTRRSNKRPRRSTRKA